jgi:hypothetical protein
MFYPLNVSRAVAGPALKLFVGTVARSCATACRFFWLYALNVSRAVIGPGTRR